MRFHPSLLLQIAAVVLAGEGCSSSGSSVPNGGSCQGFTPNEHTVDVDPAAMCAVLAQSCPPGNPCFTPPDANGETLMFSCAPCGEACKVPNAYVQAYAAANPPAEDAGVDADEAGAGDASDGGDVGGDVGVADASANCPTWSGTLTVTCTQICEGRRTAGMHAPSRGSFRTAGEYFACCAHLEAVSVFAFARLERELRAHGAPQPLIDEVRRARRDEVRHARAMGRLARRHGCAPEPARVEDVGVRPLFAIARENAIEGCVRETYGAVSACVRAARASDPEVRATLRSIAVDECGHAAIAWRIAEWAASKLNEEERLGVKDAMEAAVFELHATNDEPSSSVRTLCGAVTAEERRRILALLRAQVFDVAA